MWKKSVFVEDVYLILNNLIQFNSNVETDEENESSQKTKQKVIITRYEWSEYKVKMIDCVQKALEKKGTKRRKSVLLI